MANSARMVGKMLVPWCGACSGRTGLGSCPFDFQNTGRIAPITLLLKNGKYVADLQYCQCHIGIGDLNVTEIQQNVIDFRQRRGEGLWDVSIPIAEISAIFYGPLKFDQEDDE